MNYNFGSTAGNLPGSRYVLPPGLNAAAPGPVVQGLPR